MPDNRYYYFKDAKGNRHTVNKAAFDNDREGFAKAFPGARMEVIDRKTGRRGDVDVKDAGRVGDFGAHLFTGQTVKREKYQPKTSLGKAAQSVAQEKWGGKESELVKGLREADALKRRDEEQMPIDYTKPSAVKQMVGRTHREQQTLDRRIEQAGREAGKDVIKPLREKEARLKTPVVDTGDADINSHVINTQEQAERQLAESGLEFANKHLDDYVSSNIINEFKTATAKGAAAESALSKASPFAYMAAGKAYNEALDPDKLLKHLQEKANADIAKVLSQPKMQAEIGLKAAAYGLSPEEYIEKSLIPGLQTKLAADFDKSELSRSMPKSTAEYILRGVNESMLGTIMSMGMTSKKQRQYAQQGMAMTDNGENPDVNPGMAARVARGTLGFVADAPAFGAAGKAGAAVAGKVFGNGVAQTARIANSTLGGRIARMAGSGMVSQGVTGVLYGSTNAAVQNYSTGDDTSIGNTVKLMAMGGLSEGASWATMGGIGGVVGAGIYNVSGVKRIPAKAFQLAMEGIGMHMGGNVAKAIEGHDTDWLSVEGNLEACANVIALKLTHAKLPKRQEKDGVKESYLDVVARNIKSLMTSDGQRAAFGGYTFTNEEKELLFGSASAPKRNESIYGYDVHDNPLTRKESLTSWAMRAKKTAAKGKGEKDTDAEFVKTAYDEIMADNTIPWDTKAKFSALVMGTVPSERPMMENCRIEGGSVNEYSKNGELLSKNSFKSIDERNSIIYSLNMKREDQRLSNAYGAAQIKDEKTAQATLEAVAEANGMTAEQLKTAMDKQPLRRSEEEQNACVALRKAYEDEQFVPGTLHAEQSNTEGKDVVEENNLGTENPNNEAVAKVLGDLTKAEDALQAAMDGNDVLKEEYERMQKAGMSNPQIYMELFNSGLTQEQLAPLADYINALSKAQGMSKGTQDKIVETTQKHVGQWSYKDELNGEKQNGEQMLFVKDNKGRVLIVGAGDVAFDGEGRVRDGDMLTVYDPATREMDFVHAKDVTLERTASSEEYAKDYQRQLEELNSTVYAEMQQQDGKPNEASLSQTKPGEQPVGEEGNEALLGLTKPTKPVGEKETEPVGEEPVATFADGTPVPMMKDSKGRETADYSQMSPEQGAEWMSSQFGENAEAAVDGQIKRAEKTLKDAEKIKVDYTGDLNDAKEAEAQKTMAVDAAKKELELYTNIKKAMTEKKVKAGMERVSSVGGVGEVGSVGVAREKFESGLRVVGNKRTRTLADGSKLRGHYEIVDADSLTPSHNANDGYKKSEGFPVNEEGRTINDRDYENDKQAQLVTDMIAMKYDGQAVDQVPVVTSDGIVVDGNGRTMAGQKAAKDGTDGAYLEALKENAENYGFTAEQIEQSGIKHPRLVLVSDEPMKYDTATFAKFNKNEKKAQGNTQQAVANSKKLSTDEIGTIISEIEGSGSLDAFFNNPSAINSLLTRLVDKGVIGLNEVAGLREGENKLSASGKDFVKNLLLGSVFSENTIRMMGADAMLKTKALNGIRAVTDNMKLGDYALMKEIDQAVQLLYEARQGGSGVDAYLRTPAMFGENAADRFDPISQAIALALEGKAEDFRELMMAYNRNAAPYADASQTEMFGERPTKEDFVNEFLKLRNWKDYETRHSSKEGNGDVGGSEGGEPETSGGSGRRRKEGLAKSGDKTLERKNLDDVSTEENGRALEGDKEGKPENDNGGSHDRDIQAGEEQREVDEAVKDKPHEASLSPTEPLGEKGASAQEGEKPLAILPKKEENTLNPIVKAAENYKKDHPLTEGEIRSSDVDDIAKDMAVDYLNGEVTDDLHRAVYESIYGKVKDAKMKNAAEKFAKEKEAATEAMGEVQKPQQKADDAAVEASNKKVNDLWKDLLKAGREDLSASFIGLNARQLEVLPKLVSAMAENAYLRIKRGMHNLEDVVKEMRKEFAPAAQVFKKEDVDAIYEQMMNIRYRDGEQRMSLKEWADYYEKTSPKHKEELVGDSKTAEERKQAEKKFIDAVKLQLAFGRKIKSIIELRKIAERHDLKDIKDTDLQELAEAAIVMKARGIASSESTNDAVKFERIKKLYENQPSLNQRDSERVMKQQYSTPAPYAFLADMYVKAGMEVKSALEPSAGNGMLTIGLPKDAVHVNDIDAQRLANLQRQGFKNITSQDGTQPFADKDVDVVVTNPPFGSATPKEYDGYKISSLEGQMAINALESMKDNGRAAIIIGGKTEYAKNGSLTPKDKALLGYLYSHYNVEDVINVDGSLYAKQGTTYPTRIILINGRRYDENAYPPVKDKARAEAVKSYDELYKRINDDILRSGRMDSPVGEGGEKVNAEPDKQGAAGAHEEGLRMGQSRGGKRKATDGSGGIFDEPSVRVPDDELGNGRRTGREPDGELHNGDSGADTTGTEPTQSEGRGNNSNRHGVGGSLRQPGNAGRTNTEHINNGPSTVLKPKPAQERSLSTEKVGYAPKSENPFTLQSVMPADQQEAVNKNLEKLGDADQFLVDELGYNDKDDLYSHLAAEQVDSVALAIQQAKKGNAFIIGDMTGIGKGRQAASLIRYAKKQGQVPVYFTKTAGLLSDVYRDLVDIGSPELRPFVFGSSDEAKITDSDGKVVYKLPTKEEKERVIDYIEKNGKLPEEYDYVLTTYSQVGNGVYEFDENDNRKERKLKKGDKFGPSHFSGQARRDAIEKLISNGYLILDESHTAGGQSNQGNYFQHIIQKAKNVTFFSATFAKRPDNMPIYALRTAMNEGGMKASDLIDAVKRGGATLQEIMSQTLTQCGQMIRRERDMTGVTIDWKPIDDPVVVSEQREQYDKTIELFNDIINFQKNYVMPYIDERNEELAAIQATIGLKKGTKALGIASTPFASKAFNTVQQVLLSLKAKEAAKRAIDYLKQGVKPVIALNNTNESQSGEIKENEEVEEPDLGTSLKKGLAGTLRYTKKDSKNNADSGTIDLASLGDEAVNAYNQLMTKIEHASTGLALSPIDVIKNELQKAGYKVGELTGRKTQFIYNDNGSVSKVKRTDTDKKKLAREFNDGSLDALILNKSASTGISLHASSKFNDQRKRVMIVAQQQLDVNDEVQMRGRIDRTGQVQRGAYEYIVSQIPAEQRLLMMFKAKLKSLDANTTSSQKSKFNEMEVADITNKYGDRIVKEYMAEHLDLYSRMADPFGWEKNGADLYNIDSQKLINSSGGKDYEDGQAASKLLGRMALLRVNEQEKMLQEIGDLYAAEIQRLNEMDENDLEITELPLKAKTINKGIWKEGSEPGGDNAFADNTYVEKVNMAVLKKPMKAEEVKKAQDGLTGNRSWDEYRKEKITAAKEYFDNKITEATEKYEERAVKTATKAKEKYIKDAKKAQKDTGMSDEQIEKMAGYQYDSVYGDEKTKLDEVVKNLKSKYGVFERALETFNTDDAFVLPTDMNNPAELSGFGNSYGRLIDIKITDNFSPNASTVSFATLDGRRKITFPINGKVGIGSDKADVIGIIDRLTRQASAMGDKHLRVLSMDASNWDKLTSNESRKDGYIITGNLLQALIDTKEQGLGGQLVKYTTDTGEVKTGILMPEKFEPKGLANDKPINSVAEKFELPSNKGGITEITSSDGDVKIEQGFDYMKMARNYTIRVPKSNKKGGKYFLDKELLKMVDGGNFETRGNTMLAEIKADKLKDVLDRLSELGVKVREESGVHYRTEPNYASLSLSKPLEGRIAETVEKVSKQTGGKVKMVNSVEEIGNEEVRRDIENGKQVTGWYDENTGEVHLYMPNIHDSYTAEKTVWHETVGHKGMRGLLGDKFNDYMRGLWLDLDNPVNAELRAYVKERMGKDSMGFYDAIEEFIAESAEKGKGEPGFWNYIKNKVTDALHEIGYRISPNVKDVKYMLWLAKNVQKKGNDPWWKMRADAVKWKIEHENVEYTKIHGGEFYENDGKNHDFEDMTKEEWDEATDGQIHYRTAPSAATALDRYHKMLDAHGYMATEAFMDNMLSLEKLMKAVDPSIKKIEDVNSSMNPYVLQNTMQGAMSDKMTLFEHQVMKPLDKAMSDVLDSFAGKNTEEKIRECNLYMIGKHGLERNRVLFVRDKIREERRVKSEESNSIDALEASWKGERNILGKKLRSGQIDLREYYRQMDEWIVQNIDKDFKAEEHDYSGMHGLQEIDDLKSPYDDAGAIDSVMSQEAKMESQKKGSVDNLWKRIKDATDYSIDSDYENGLMDKTRHDRVKNMFDWYVPLRKYDEATAEDVYGYISGDNGKGFIGETLMNAKGRKSLSDVNVLAQIGAMGNRAIRNGGQNAVKQAFARFVRNSGEQNLVKETKVWVEKKGTDMNGNDIWEEAYPQIPDNASAHDIATIVDAFETDMKTKQAKGEAKTLSNSTDIGFKFARAKNKSEHFVDVKIAGRTHSFVVMGNPRAAQALNGMLENSSPNSALLKGLKSTTRFMAQMATSYSPEFVMRNIIRDAEFASSNVTAKEGVMYGKKWLRYYAELNPLNVAYNEGAGALKSLKWKDLKEGVGMGLYARYREGTLGNSKMERYFKEFMENGGETGWVQVKTMQEWEKDYKRDVSREHSKVAKTGKALRDFLVGNVENLNEVAENMARFATFCTSRDLGRSAVRSAYDAKQVSTNFNRHGSGDAIKTFKNGEMGTSKEMRRNVYGTIASYLRNYSMFFNAGVQSTHLLMNNVKKAPVGTVASMMAMPFGLGIMAAVVNNAMIASEDEKKRKGVKDPYGELPEYIRRNNLCIYKGGGEFVTIPLAIELRAFYGLGDIAAGMTAAKNVKSTRNAAMDAVGCMSQLLPVVDFMNSATFDKEPGKELLKGVLPTAAAPFVEWWLNSDWKGTPIRREGDYTKNRPAWMNAYSGTPEKLMDLNKWVNAKTNDVAPGNENMRGNSLLDEATDPAMLNHIIGTLGGGAATFITRGTGLVLKYSDGREQEIETKDIPFLRSLMYTPSEQTSMARTKAKWYGYKESMEKGTSNYSMLKNKNVPLTERIRNAADRHRFEQSADYARIRIIKDAEKQMKRWNKMKRLNADDKKQVDFANKNIEMIMQKAVEQMDKVSDD